MTEQELLNTIFSESTWYNANAISQLTGLSESTVQTRLCTWKSENRIFSLKYNNDDFYPGYVFDEDYQPLIGVSNVLNVLRKEKSDIKIAAWFVSVNSYLRNARPIDIMDVDTLIVIKAAEIELMPIDHG